MDKRIIEALNRLRAEIITNYKSMGLLASGRFERETEVIDRGDSASIVAPHYVFQMENGRAQGKRPPIAVIRQWIEDKNRNAGTDIPIEAAWGIAANIGKNGITVPNKFNRGGVVSSILTQQTVDKLVIDVSQIIKSDLLKILKQ